MTNPIRIVSLDCWHSNELIYQATGSTADGMVAHVHYRGGRHAVWFTAEDTDASPVLRDFFVKHAAAHDPSTIRLADLKAWTAAQEWPIEWALDRITGYGNEPGDPALGGGVLPPRSE